MLRSPSPDPIITEKEAGKICKTLQACSMKLKKIFLQFSIGLLLCNTPFKVPAHEILFCGERIPLTQSVAEKLMNCIKTQIRYGLVSQLRQKWSQYTEIIERILRATGLPEDFKYLPIVESGLRNVVSSAGAAGYWQLMPGTAAGMGLRVNAEVDERNDFDKATSAACQSLAQNYMSIWNEYKISSWVLTAAAYNFGIGNIRNAIRRQGNNYFEMNLNKETAEYVYKIIAIKELFEYPELYMKNFDYNLFSNNTAVAKNPVQKELTNSDDSSFGEMNVKFNGNDGNHPEVLASGKISEKKNGGDSLAEQNSTVLKETYIWANIKGDYKDIKDNDEVFVVLGESLNIGNSIFGKGNTLKGHGWVIDGKVYIDFGYGTRLILIDTESKKHDGVLVSELQDNNLILLKKTIYRE